jgi:adenylosuccinate synthase
MAERVPRSGRASRSDVASATTVYAFRVGSRSYPTRIVSMRRREVAERLRQARKAGGDTTGRLRAVSPAQLTQTVEELARGTLPDGW